MRTGHYDLVLIGDSITQTLEGGGEWEPLKAVWAKHYAVRNALNLGYSGYRTENILSNLKGGELDFKESPKVFILLIGTNDTDNQRLQNGSQRGGGVCRNEGHRGSDQAAPSNEQDHHPPPIPVRRGRRSNAV